jgi:hypothetical protein
VSTAYKLQNKAVDENDDEPQASIPTERPLEPFLCKISRKTMIGCIVIRYSIGEINKNTSCTVLSALYTSALTKMYLEI